MKTIILGQGDKTLVKESIKAGNVVYILPPRLLANAARVMPANTLRVGNQNVSYAGADNGNAPATVISYSPECTV